MTPSDQWLTYLRQLNRLLMEAARLDMETEASGVELGPEAARARALYRRIAGKG